MMSSSSEKSVGNDSAPSSPRPVGSVPSSPVQDEPAVSSPLYKSSPVRPDSPRSSPLRYDSSPSSSGSLPVKRKRYEFYDPEVPQTSKYWPQNVSSCDTDLMVPHEHEQILAHEDNSKVLSDSSHQESGIILHPSQQSLPDYSEQLPVALTAAHENNLAVMTGAGSSDFGYDIVTGVVCCTENDYVASSASSSIISEEESSEEEIDCESDKSIAVTSDSDDDSASATSLSLTKIYEGCGVSVDEGVMLLMELFHNHKLEKGTVGDMLKVVLKLLPQNNAMPKSLHNLFKYVENLSPLPSEKIHFYCKTCHFYLGPECVNCNLCGSESNKFFQLSLSHQIKNLFENQNLAEIIDTYSDRRNNHVDGNFSDICDGSEYQRVHVSGQYNLTLLGHTDGVSVSESSNVSLWPIEYVICELPPHLRFRFVLVSGVWLDSSKPLFNSYFKPFVDELRDIFETGIKWDHPHTKVQYSSSVVVPGFCADAPVRAQIQNVLSHGGRYCCNICEQKMVKMPEMHVIVPGVKKKSRRRVFSFQENPSQLRTSERMTNQGEISRARQQVAGADGNFEAVKGVKGRSIISNVPKCDRSSVVFPEYMHLVLGIMKQFMKLWFSTQGPVWSLKKHQDEINAMLENIRVPDFVTRIPRTTASFSKWKANEFRSFLLYYSLVILSEFMNANYLQHWLLFVGALYLLLEENVSEISIVKAEAMLRMFLRDFTGLYQAEDFTYNLHNLIHLGLVVRRWGPLWSNSAFMFESYNGSLTKFIHGSKNQGKELINTVKLVSGFQVLKARLNICSPASGGRSETITYELRNRVKKVKFNAMENAALSASNLKYPVLVYYRAFNGKETYTSSIYSRQFKRNNFTISYTDSAGKQKFGEIKCFCQSAVDENLKVVLINPFVIEHMRIFSHNETRLVVKHIIPVRETDDVEIIPLQNMLFKVIRVRQFVCIPPNKYEVNL